MTAKYLTGAYPAGYALNVKYAGLVLEATATVGGTGVSASALATIANYGAIQATTTGSTGVYLHSGGAVTNGSITGTSSLIAGYDGVQVRGSAAIANFGTVRGVSRYSVYLSAGGIVTNGSAADTSALIEGGSVGVLASHAPVTIANFGTIRGVSFEGVYLSAGGIVTNGSTADTSALIAGGSFGGVDATGASPTIANFGTIQGYFTGVDLFTGGIVTNGSAADKTALIEGHTGNGVWADESPLTITNYGTIQGRKDGVYVGAGGTVTNGSATDTTALIEGGGGLLASGLTTVINYGTILGSGGTAVRFRSAADVLVVESVSVFEGAVLGDGGTLDLASGMGDISALSGGNVTVAGTMPTTTFTNFGVVKIGTGAQFTLTVKGAIGAGGTRTLSDAGVFTVTGALAVSGTVGGAGTFTLADGTLAVNAGATIGVAHWSLTGGTATIDESLAYRGVFHQGAGAALSIATGDTLTLTGAAGLSGTIDGAGAVKVSNATASGLTIGGAATLDDAGAVDQTGQVTVSGGRRSPPILAIDAGATWTIAGGGGIGRGHTWASVINNSGTLIDSATGMSVVTVKVVDAGAIVAAAGTLDFTRALTGVGTMSVDGGATLEVGNAAASTLSMTFNGGNAVLALKAPSKFAATIIGFAPGDTIDLLGKQATSAKLGAGDTLVIRRNATVIATLQLAGNYTGDTFNVASDGAGGTSVTVTTGAAVAPPPAAPVVAPRPVLPFVAAMAGMGANAGCGHVTGGAHLDAWRPILSASRAMVA